SSITYPTHICYVKFSSNSNFNINFFRKASKATAQTNNFFFGAKGKGGIWIWNRDYCQRHTVKEKKGVIFYALDNTNAYFYFYELLSNTSIILGSIVVGAFLGDGLTLAIERKVYGQTTRSIKI
ncbi:hypothetical protein ACJX0J_033905, partial [Zea mays]